MAPPSTVNSTGVGLGGGVQNKSLGVGDKGRCDTQALANDSKSGIKCEISVLLVSSCKVNTSHVRL